MDREYIESQRELAKRVSKQMEEIEKELENPELKQKERISLRAVYSTLAGTLQRVLQASEPSKNEHFDKSWGEMTETDDPERSGGSKEDA